MFSEVFDYYMAHLLWLVPATVVAVVAIFMLWVKHTNDLLWTDFWVIFPFFGKMHKWVQDTHGIGNKSTWESDGMPRPERQLCATYLDRKKDPLARERDFDRAKVYLKLTHQSDITPTTAGMWILLVILTVAEAAGTGLLIAPFVASEITGNQMLWIGYVIAGVMAAGLLGVTHFAGTQAYKFGTIRNHIGKVGRAHDDLITEIIGCGDDQSVDEIIPDKSRAQTAKIRYANRVLEGAHDRGTLVWVFVVAAFLAVLLSFVTWMRIEGIKTQLTKQTAGQIQGSDVSAANPFSSIPGMAGVNTVPSAVSRSSKNARKHVETEITGEQFSEGIAGAAVLALIYLITQGLGFLNSLKHSFVGSGRRAYDYTRGEASYKIYENKYIMPMITTAQKRLERLRACLSENDDYCKHPSTMSCYDYFIHQRQLLENGSPSAPQSTGASAGAAVPADDIIRKARKILDEKDVKMRRKLLEYTADGSEQMRGVLLEAIKYVKGEQARPSKEEQLREAQEKLENELLGD